MPKRPLNFALFASDRYYPKGGWFDYRGSYNSLIVALEAVADLHCDQWHIVDLSIGAIVKEGART